MTDNSSFDRLRCPETGARLVRDGDVLRAESSARSYRLNGLGVPLFAESFLSSDAERQRDHYDRIAAAYVEHLDYPHTEVYTDYLDRALYEAIGTRDLGVTAEPVLLVSGAVGGLLALVGFRWHVGVLVLAFFGYTVFLYLFMPLEDRYILPAIPVLTLLAGGGAAILGSGSFRRVFVIRVFAVVMLALMYAGWNVTTFNGLLNAPDSRERAIDWVAERATADDGIVLAMNPVKLPAATSGLKVQAVLAPASLDAVDRLALSGGRAGGFHVVHLNRFAPDALEGAAGAALLAQLRDSGFRYILVAQRHDLPRTRFHEELAQLGRPVETYDPTTRRSDVTPPDMRTTILVQNRMVHDYSGLRYLGPRVEIYDLERVRISESDPRR